MFIYFASEIPFGYENIIEWKCRILPQCLTVCSTGFETHQRVECIGQVQGDTVTDMIMIVMEAGKMIKMVMEETGNMAIEMMIGMADMGIQTVVMGTVMAGIMKTAIAEMVIGMMTTEVEVEALMIISMAQEAGALIETVLLMTMVHHLGMFTFEPFITMFFSSNILILFIHFFNLISLILC